MLKPVMFSVAVVLGMAGCAAQSNWATDYMPLASEQTAAWRVRSVEVKVPETLTTSEENSYTPNFDIVWHGEPYGDRRAQVAEIVREGISAGTGGLRGRTAVTLVATVQQFHAITPITRSTNFSNAGVHDIRFTVQAFGANGAPLTEPQVIRADFPALTGAAGDQADAQGATQRVQIVHHIAEVMRGWTGQGPDVRRSFSRMGR